MSLLMDALKRAEYVKRGARSESEPPAAASVAAPCVGPSPTERAEFSLALVEGDLLEPAPEHDISQPPSADEHRPSAAGAAEADSASIPASPSRLSASVTAAREDMAEHAAHLFAASAVQRAAQRRREVLGAFGLAGILTVAVGSYYYYAALAQRTSYLGLPQPQPASATETVAGASGVDAAAATAISGGEDLVVPAAALPAADPSLAASSVDPAVPAQTPWREGPAPTAAESTDDWQPAPVDIRALPGEEPLPVAETADDSAAPAAAITITRGSQPNGLDLDLLSAYADFQSGRLADAQRTYRRLLDREPGSRDAHLGLAAIAMRDGRTDAARAHYRAILQRDPKDVGALAALTQLEHGRPADSESRLKLMLAERPDSAELHFALANLYAEQQRWAYAQQAYFEAQRLAPGQPDYAFNLAVSLEHLGQRRLALDHYRRAVALAAEGNAQFDIAAARQRIAALGADRQP